MVTGLSARFRLTPAPQLAPGSCRVCGSATKLPMVDMGYLEDYHGNVYYCSECINEVANLFGFFSTGAMADSQDTVAKLRIELADMAELNTRLHSIVNDLTNAIAEMKVLKDNEPAAELVPVRIDSVSNSDVNVDVGVDSSNKNSIEEQSETLRVDAKPELRIVEPDDGPQLDGIQSTTSSKRIPKI